MSALLNANGVPFDQERLLNEIGLWLNSKNVVKAILSHHLSTVEQLSITRHMAEDTLKQGPGRMAPDETAVIALHFLDSRPVRMQIAKFLAPVRCKPKKDIMRDLWVLRMELMLEYKIDKFGAPLTPDAIRDLTEERSMLQTQAPREADA